MSEKSAMSQIKICKVLVKNCFGILIYLSPTHYIWQKYPQMLLLLHLEEAAAFCCCIVARRKEQQLDLEC